MTHRSKVLIAGGGVAALEAALALRALAEERLRVELLAAEPHFWYRPLAVAEPFELAEIPRLDLAVLAAAAGAIHTPGTLVAVDAGARVASTAFGMDVPYDFLLIACGGVAREVVRGALTFRGAADTAAFAQLLGELETGDVRSVAFAVPAGAAWVLPAYELALLTAARLQGRRVDGVELTVVTPEEAPLALFGRPASDAIGALLEERGIALRTRSFPSEFRDGRLLLVQDDPIAADRVVALPRLEGQRIDGIPQTAQGFVPVDEHCRVPGVANVYAAGDVTTYPVKQGGIAARQADAAAEAIAADAGLGIDPRPFRPVLRGILLTGGGAPRYLKRDVEEGESLVSREALWWPPAKIAGAHLGPFLAAHTGVPLPPAPGEPAGVPVDVEPAPDVPPAPGLEVLASADAAAGATVGDVVAGDPLVVAPEDTLGEVAERMRERDFASALVAEYGRLTGILTARDLLRAYAGRAHPSEARVREWMTADPIAVTASTTLDAAALLMSEHGVHHLAVVEGRRPVAIVGLRDVVRPALAGGGSRLAVGLGF